VFLRLLGGAGAIALSSTVTGTMVCLMFLALLRRLLDLRRPWRLAGGLVAPAGATLAAAIPCLLCLAGSVGASWPVALRLGLMVCLFLAVWLPAVLLLLARCPEEFQPIWRLPWPVRRPGHEKTPARKS
jgi:TRAP-type mannitol/chloroaromatic compound transport system permease large subunit